MKTLSMVVALIPSVGVAQPQEVATIAIQDQIAVLYDDGTWAYADPEASITPRPDKGCLSPADAASQFCPQPDQWTNIVFSSVYGINEQTMTTPDQLVTLSTSYDPNYGHEGDLSSFEETPSGGFLDSAVGLLFGATDYSTEVVVVDDAAIMVSRYADADIGYLSLSIEILGHKNSLYLELNSFPQFGATEKEQERDPQTAAVIAATTYLFDSVTVNGTPLSTILENARQ